MNSISIIGFDVGGTNSRAAVVQLTDGTLTPHPDFPEPIKEKAADKAALREFIRGVSGRVMGAGVDVDGAVVALAGPVTNYPDSNRQKITMTNWPHPRDIFVDEFEDWGLPKGRTRLLNDMEAGCYGLVRHLREKGAGSESFEALTQDDVSGVSSSSMPTGNRIFVAPGTGLGAAGIVEPALAIVGAASRPVYPVPAELQHTPIPISSSAQRIVADWLQDAQGIVNPVWEDFVSGRGLVNIYQGLRANSPDGRDVTRGVEDPAAAIAEAGKINASPVAQRALWLFYTCLGRFCQLMALGFQSFGGVFIGGASTIKNREFIREGVLMTAFLDNPGQHSLLQRFPVYLVSECDLNLDGTHFFEVVLSSTQETNVTK